MLLFLRKTWGRDVWGSLLLWPLGQRLGQGYVLVHGGRATSTQGLFRNLTRHLPLSCGRYN